MSFSYFSKSPTAIDKLITKIIFEGSKRLRAKRVVSKNKGTAREKAILSVKSSLKRKKKNELISIFINIITKRLEGEVRKTKVAIKLKIKSKKSAFFPNFSLASAISFYYNRKLWLKSLKLKKLKKTLIKN